MGKRKNPTVSSAVSLGAPYTPPPQPKHERMLSEMHDALYTLGSKIRKPTPNPGDKLLPPDLAPQEPAGARKARLHIESLHQAMVGVRRKK